MKYIISFILFLCLMYPVISISKMDVIEEGTISIKNKFSGMKEIPIKYAIICINGKKYIYHTTYSLNNSTLNQIYDENGQPEMCKNSE